MQLRALARAAPHGNLKVMLPMVTVPAEIAAACRAVSTRRSPSSRAEGVAADAPAARHHGRGAGRRHRAEGFAAAAFFSIGSNDLTQYVMAAARDSHRVAELCDVDQPGGACS